MATQTYDVCIVGSGPAGGIAAYALASAGAKVALVEAGRKLVPGVDFSSHGSVHQNLDKRLAAGRSPLFPVGDFSDRDHFTAVGDRPKHGLLRALGGRSLCWAGHSLRFGPLDFKRWPISYDEVAPYYSRAERLMRVYGHRDGLSNMPDGEYLKPVALRCGEEMLRQGVERLKTKGRKMEFVSQRKAMATQPVRGHAPCHYCGHCMAGCEIDAKYTSANTPIPLAMKTGNLSLFTEATMTRILMKDPRRVEGIEYTKADGSVDAVKCRVLVLACSAIETARQLLINRTPQHSSGLANSSGQVGRNLTSHFGTTVVGFFPQLRGRDHSNDDGTDYYHGLLTGLYWDKPNPNFEGTYQVQCGSGVHPLGLAVPSVPGFGAQMKRKLFDVNNCHAALGMQGSMYRSPRKFVDLDPDRRDRYGAPLPRVHMHYEDNDLAMARDMVATSEEIIRAAGGTVYSTPGEVGPEKLQVDANHWVGTARMGTDPVTSVVNKDGQCHDVPNLLIADTSVFAAYPEKNPTLTNIALAWRMADRLAERVRASEI